jgi:hypothetical protein
VNQSGAAVVVAEEAVIDRGVAGLVVASNVRADDSKIGLLLAGSVEGRPDIAVDARVAAIIGISAMLTLFILRRLFRS